MSLATGSSEPMLPGIRVAAFDISHDGNQLLYSTVARDGSYQLWIAPINRSAPARQVGQGNERWPHFGPAGEIVYLAVQANENYLERMDPDGRDRAKVIAYPIHEMQSISPGRTWLTAVVDYPEGTGLEPWNMVIPLKGGEPLRLCKTYCYAFWASSGKFLYIPVEAATHSTPGRSLAIRWDRENPCRRFPLKAFRPRQMQVLSGVRNWWSVATLSAAKTRPITPTSTLQCIATFIAWLSRNSL